MVNSTWIGSPNHYNGRNGYTVTHITLHIMVGRLAGTDATFQNPVRQASSTYGIGSTGLIHQYVRETDAPWTDSNYASNCQTISIEHEGGMAGVPCTKACMDASAALCADIARRYGWPRLWHDGLKGNVWLHREIPGSDHAGCPDRAANGLDVDYVINRANQLLTGAGTVSAQDLYETKGNDGRNLFDGIIQTRNELKDRAADALIQTKGNDGRNVLDSVIQARYDIADLKTQLTAQTAAIEALSKALGANPADISKIVADAVRAKLDSLEISVTATDKTTEKEG